MVIVRCVAVALFVAGFVSGLATSAAAEDYPVVDGPVPAFEGKAPGRYVDDIPIIQDSIAAPWEPMKRLTGPRCGCDGIAVPEGW